MKKNNPLISCIIPTKNRPELVQQAIGSVLAQSYRNIEIIVIDDSTNDETKRILSSFETQIRYIKNENSRGAPYSRNIGLIEAKGDVIAFLDDDDQWFTDKIKIQLGYLDRYPLVTCNYVTRLQGKRYFMRYPGVISYEDLLCFNALGSCSFVIVDRNAARDCFFDESIKIGQDWDYWLTVMKKNGIVEAANAGQYLVQYNSNDFLRITTTNDMLGVFFGMYNKRVSEYTPHTIRLMLLYNAFPVQQSFSLWVFREWAKANMKGKGNILFMTKLIAKRLFGRMELF
jgi:glycosyltransferase involved in cell wall biosynthesis